MTFEFTVQSIFFLLTAIVTLFAGFLNYHRREQPGITSLTIMLGFISLLSLASFFQYSVIEPDLKFFFLRIGITASEIFVTAVFLFVIDFFHLLKWFTKKIRRTFWVGLLLLIILEWTNSLHHLFWTGYIIGSEGPNDLILIRGPLTYIRNFCIYGSVAYTILLLIHVIVNTKGWDRLKALVVLFSILVPYSLYFVSSKIMDRSLGAISTPFGFVLTALMMSWIVYEDLQRLVRSNTYTLKKTIDDLQEEIFIRQKLENELRNSRGILSEKLANQSTKLSGLYDLLLFSNESLDFTILLGKSLEKIFDVMDCAAVCYFRLEHQQFILEASHQFNSEIRIIQQPIPTNWLSDGRDIRADIDIGISSDLPKEFQSLGFNSSLNKWVIVQDREIGMLGVFWKEKRRFSVEEIALFGALTDGLGLILENIRLRQKSADFAMRQERRRLARDLHDSVSQSLHSMMLSAQTAKKQLVSDPIRLNNTLTHLELSSRQALKEMRLLLFELRLTGPVENGLEKAIQIRLEAVEQRAGIETNLIMKEGASWQKQWEPELYPLIMEALNNSLKHAYARHVWVIFSNNGDGFTIEIKDDGVGFDTLHISSAGMGLHNMEDRCEKLGAKLTINSSKLQGTSILVNIAPTR